LYTSDAMACRGVLFAITDHKISKLEAAQGDDEVMNVVQMEIEQPWDETWLYQLDKAWDAIHRCVTDGRIGFTNGEFPIGLCILGGSQLHRGENHIVALKTPREATEIALALRNFDRARFRERYNSLDPADYGRNHDQQDLEYSWEYFSGLADFYARAAQASRHVVFTVDQ